NGHEVSFLSISNVNDDIIAGLVSAGTALSISGLTFSATGTSGSHVLDVVGTAGTWIWPELADANGLDTSPTGGASALFGIHGVGADTTTPIATQIENIRSEDDTWYAVINPYYGEAFSEAIAVEVESAKKLFIQATPDTDIITTVL